MSVNKIDRFTTKDFDNILVLIKEWSREVYDIELKPELLFYDKLPKNSKFKIKNKKFKIKIKNLKGPTSAFIYFTQTQILENSENDIFNMKKSSMSDIWSQLKPEEKKPYLKLAALDRSRYNKVLLEDNSLKNLLLNRSIKQRSNNYIDYKTDSDEE